MMRRTDIHSPSEHLLELSPSGSGISPRLLDAEGGFLWWYVDLVSPEGDGLVIIWSYGLPFLPGYASAARRGDAPPASSRPSLTLSTYKDGELDFYLLQEFHPDEVSWESDSDGDSWRFANSLLSSKVVDQKRHLSVDLHLEVPEFDDPVTLELRGSGPGCVQADQTHDPGHRRQDDLPEHDWVPLLAGLQSQAHLTIDGQDQVIQGRLYHDRNGGKTPLGKLDLQSWVWGRLPLPDREFIYYVLDGKDGSTQSLLLSIDDSGAIDLLPDATFHRSRPSKNLGGLTWWPSMTIRRDDQHWLSITHDRVVDSGPFYMRTLPRGELFDGTTTRGVAEVCEPDRIDLPHHRPLVRMRVHQRRNRNSMWLPLFTGPREGRVKRLVQSWLSPLSRS